MTHIKRISHQQGFSILAVILVIVTVIVAIGVWALSGQTNTNNNNSNDTQISAFINDALAIKSAYKALVISGANPNNIVFIPNTASTSSAPNILDPTNGVQLPKIYTGLVKPGTSFYWLYNPSNAIFGMSVMTQVLEVPNISDDACKRINYNMYGISAIFSSTAPMNFYVPNTVPGSLMVTGMPGYGADSGTGKGLISSCFGNSAYPNQNVFYLGLQN